MSALAILVIAVLYVGSILLGWCTPRCLAKDDVSETAAVSDHQDQEDDGEKLIPRHGTETEILAASYTNDNLNTDSGFCWHTSPRSILDHDLGNEGPTDLLVPGNSTGTTVMDVSEISVVDTKRTLTSDDGSDQSMFDSGVDKFFLAQKNIGMVLGCFAMLTTKTGGIFPCAVAEEVYNRGLLWTQLPVSLALGLIIGELIFGGRMKKEGERTFLDLIERQYGLRFAGVLSIIVVSAEVFFCAVVASSAAALMNTTMGIQREFAVAITIFCLVCYLLVGGLYAMAVTNVIHYLCLCSSLWISVLFSLSYGPKLYSDGQEKLLGRIEGLQAGLYVENFTMLTLGSIPFQSYFQCIFSCRTSRGSKIATLVAVIGCFVNSIPSLVIGSFGRLTDWRNVTYLANPNLLAENTSVVPYYAITNFVPLKLSPFITAGYLAGLMAMFAATMLGSSFVFAHNIYNGCFRRQASDKEVMCIGRLSLILCGVTVSLICIFPTTPVHVLWTLPFDWLYVLIFPQLYCVVHFKYANTYGAIVGLILGVILRLLIGDVKLGVRPLVNLPFVDPIDGPLLPARSLCMLSSMLCIIIVSMFYHWLFCTGIVGSTRDIFTCFERNKTSTDCAITGTGNMNGVESIERMTSVV